MSLLQDVLRKVVPKVKEMKLRTGSKITVTNTAVAEQSLKKEDQVGRTTGLTTEKRSLVKPGTMATKGNTKTDGIIQNIGMIAEKTISRGELSHGRDNQATGRILPQKASLTGNRGTSGSSLQKVNLPVTIGIDQWKERRGSGTTVTGQSAYSVTGQKTARITNFMTTSHNPIENTPYSAIDPRSIGSMAMKKDGHRSLDAGHSSVNQTMTLMRPNPTAYQTPVYYGLRPPNLNRFPSMYQGSGPFYPTQAPIVHPHYLVPVQPPLIQPYHRPEVNMVGGNIGFPNSMNSLGTISKQNTELLNSIIALMNRERADPRNKRPATSGQPPRLSQFPTQLQPADIARLMPQINNLVKQASNLNPSARSASDLDVKSPTTQAGTSGSSLSAEDIMRIREKKERLKVKRQNEKELCRREAMYMREELNKHLEKKQKHVKKPRASHQPYTSPASSAHSGEGHSDNPQVVKPTTSKPMDSALSPDQTTSSKMLWSVPTSEEHGTAPENEASPRPTGIVTPKPRPVHPLFMESRSSFPLTELTLSRQSAMSSPSPTHDDKNRVISEIDQTLSVLKQEMQTNRNNTDVKDYMSKLLQLVIKLGGATPHNDQADTTEEISTSVLTESAVSSVRTPAEDQSEENLSETIHDDQAPESTGDTDRILYPAETPKDTIPFISDSSAFSSRSATASGNAVTETPTVRNDVIEQSDYSVIPFISDDLSYSPAPSRTVVTTTESSGEKFPVLTSTGAGKYAVQNIDELLSKVKPAIESINRMQSLNQTGKCLQGDSSFSGEKIQVIGSAKVDHRFNTSTSKMVATVRSPANFTTIPSALVTVVQPRPVSALTDIQPILSLARNPEPITVSVLDEEPMVNSVLIEEPEIAMHTQSLEDKTPGRECQSPGIKSDRGTPTLDERYPELTVTESSLKNEPKSNPFYVFNPGRLMECEAICRYLESVHGVHVDIAEIFGKLCENLKALDKDSLDADVLRSRYNAALPMGILWVVFRLVCL